VNTESGCIIGPAVVGRGKRNRENTGWKPKPSGRAARFPEESTNPESGFCSKKGEKEMRKQSIQRFLAALMLFFAV
jgi:hypothetical protein